PVGSRNTEGPGSPRAAGAFYRAALRAAVVGERARRTVRPAVIGDAHSAWRRTTDRRPRSCSLGGASLGAIQVGMLVALYERGIGLSLIVGTSAGAMNVAFIASRPQTVSTADALATVWRDLRR